ncbi:MAG: sulfotransferase [Planctomycetota bacterium]|nr:sulfotransferase [Planctomycetota bacterium]
MAKRPAHPRPPDPLTQAALRALGEGQYEQAESLATRALAREPRSPQALAARASARVRMRRYAEAEEDIRAALRIGGSAPPKWSVTLALVHRGRGELDQCLAVLREAHARAPSSQIVLANLAEILSTRREHQEAYDLLLPFVARGADRPGLLAQFGRVCRFLDRAEEAVEPLGRAAARDDHPPASRQQLLFELGAVFDALERYDEAFAAVSRANALESRRYDIAGQSAAIDRVIETWTRDAVASAPMVLGSGAGLIFIVGMRRSGTTLAERILAAHPRVAAGGELPYLRQAAAAVDPEPAQRIGIVTDLAACTPDALAAGSAHYTDAVAGIRGGAEVLTDKMPANFKLLGFAQLALSQARVVWCRRDPVDTCLSCYMQPFNDNSYCADLRTLARYHHDSDRLMRHWHGALDLPIFELGYETLVNAPEPTVRELLGFCDLPFDDACLKFDLAAPAARTASTDQVAKGLYHTSVGRAAHYRAHLGPLSDELQRLAGPDAPLPPA